LPARARIVGQIKFCTSFDLGPGAGSPSITSRFEILIRTDHLTQDLTPSCTTSRLFFQLLEHAKREHYSEQAFCPSFQLPLQAQIVSLDVRKQQ